MFGAETAGAEGVVFVDEFDGDDGGGCCFGGAFADAVENVLACIQDKGMGEMYEAYAQLPIVFEIMRKGSSGRGTACDWTGSLLAECRRFNVDRRIHLVERPY